MTERNPMLVAVHLILWDKHGRILMLRRANTGYEDGKWTLPAGHVDAGESAVAATVREAREELGVEIDPDNVVFELVMHKCDPVDDDERIDFFFRATEWQGEPLNNEPHKCDAIAWVAPRRLPHTTITYVAAAVRAWLVGQQFVPFGWE